VAMAAAAAAAAQSRLKSVGSSTCLDAIEGTLGRISKESGSSEVLEGVKWRKLIKKALESAPGRTLSLKMLRRQVLVTVMKKIGDPAESKAEIHSAIEGVVGSSSKFSLDGKMVKLLK